MEIKKAENYRQNVLALLIAEKLPVEDLPAKLENFIVAIDETTIAGVAGIEIYGNYGLLRSVAVDKKFRNKGIAAQLLNAVEMQTTAKEIYLLTKTAPDYFERKGYWKIGRNEVPDEVQRSSEFSHVCPQSAIVMKKTITQ